MQRFSNPILIAIVSYEYEVPYKYDITERKVQKFRPNGDLGSPSSLFWVVYLFIKIHQLCR